MIKTIKHGLLHIFIPLFVLLLLGIPTSAYYVTQFLKDFNNSVDYSVLNDFEFYGQRVKMLDEEGTVIKTYLDQKNNIKLTLQDARADYVDYLITIEDRRFYEHKGVDFKGILRALHVNLTNGESSQGASTLTQQLVRSQVLTTDKTITRKLTEMFLALELERQCSKEEILEMYLNTTYFGYGNYGIESASKFYYGVSFNDLTLSQLCSIIPIAQSPNNFNPVNNIKLNNKKREIVLSTLLEQEKIDQTTYQNALADKSYTDVKMSREEYNENVTSIDSYYVECAYEQVIEDLMLYKELTREESINFLKDNGCLIYTYYDAEIDAMLTQLAETRYSAIDDEIQTAVVILNNSGQVKGILGGYDKKPSNYSLNRATQSTRSPGSTFKPISVYVPAIEELHYTSKTLVNDEQRDYITPYGTYSPKNYNNQYLGYIPLNTAVAKSINSVAVDLLNKLGVETGYAYAEKLGITTLVDNRNGYTDKGLSTALGGLTDGVKVIDMAVAYNTIKTSNYTTPRFYKKVIDKDGNLILFTDELPKYQSKQVIKETTSAFMMDALRNVVTNGTGRVLRNTSATVIGKTGTTNDEKDLWFVGSTPHYTLSLWYGYDTPKTIPTSNKHMYLCKEIFNQLVALGKENLESSFNIKVSQEVYEKLENKDIFYCEEFEPTSESLNFVEDATDKQKEEVRKEETVEEEVAEPTEETEPTSPEPILTPEQEDLQEYESTDIFGEVEEVITEESPLPEEPLEQIVPETSKSQDKI